MIFITVGSQKFQFNRLLKAVDELISSGEIHEEVFAQSGYSDYHPMNYAYKDFLNHDEFVYYENRADIVITHGGTGAIMGAVKKGKKVIAVPRLAKYGEHVDDHQTQLIGQFRKQNLICGLPDTENLGEAIRYVKKHTFNSYESNTERIIDRIDQYINTSGQLTSKVPTAADSKKMVKVLMVGSDPSVKGGISGVILQILQHDWNEENIKMDFIPTYKETNPIKMILYYRKQFPKVKKYILNKKPDVVHIHMSYKGSFLRKYRIHRFCIKAGVPDVIHLHGSEFKKWYETAGSGTQAKIRALLRQSKAVLVLGEKWNRAVKEIEPAAKTIVVSNTVHIPEETAVWNDKRFQVLFLGVLVKRKGVKDLLQAVKFLKETRHPDRLRVIIAGSGEEESEMKAYVNEQHLDDIVDFIGWTKGEAKKKLLKGSQMLILPSYNEGLPIAVLEAISYGLPVVATDVGDISSAVNDEENGYLLQPGDIQGLSDGILRIYSDKDLFLNMSKRSREIAEKQFSDTLYFKKISECYREVLN